MRETQPVNMSGFRHATAKIFMLFVVMLFCFAATAQDARQAKDPNDLMQEYLQKNKDLPLVKLYVQNSSDASLAQALRYAVILENPRRFPEFSAARLDEMKIALSSVQSDFKQIHSYMENGDSYEMAKTRIERARIENKVQQNNSTTPILQKAD